MKMKDFLETIPPYQEVEIEDLNKKHTNGSHIYYMGNAPNIFIHCEKCGGERFFSVDTRHNAFEQTSQIVEYIYHCNNCKSYDKIFVFIIRNISSSKLIKIGEFPIFGQPTPAKLISLIGPDKDTFLRGRRCENQGLGIGSYAYYRRVIETQKNRIIEQIQKICEQYKNNTELMAQLELAKKEQRFSTAIDLIKQNLPSSLLIDGHNPLKLLHTALSKGLHEMSDEECLARANSIRVVLTELCVRMNELLKDDKELKNAIGLLLNPDQESSYA